MILTKALTKTTQITNNKSSYSSLLFNVCSDISSPDVGQVVGQGGHNHGQLDEYGEEWYIECVLKRVQVSMMLSISKLSPGKMKGFNN